MSVLVWLFMLFAFFGMNRSAWFQHRLKGDQKSYNYMRVTNRFGFGAFEWKMENVVTVYKTWEKVELNQRNKKKI